jgi:uncharacterized protein YuzE
VGYDPVTYDPEADAVYVYFRPPATGVAARTEVVDESRMIDYATDGAIVGFEFLNVTRGIDLRDLPFSRRIEELLVDSGHEFRIFA